MRADNVRRPLLHVAAVTAGLTSGAIHAAEWTLTPSVAVSTRTERNPRLGADDASRTETANAFDTVASLNISRNTERLSLVVKPDIAVYRSTNASDLDRDEEHLNLSMGWRGETISWSSKVAIARDTTLTSELGDTGFTQANLRHDSYDVSFGPTWQLSERVSALASVGSLINRYPGQSTAFLQDYRYDSALAGLNYSASDRAVLSMTASVGRLNNKGPGDHSDNASLMLRAQYALSPVWNIALGAGPSLARSAGSTERGVVYNASLSRSFETGRLSLDVDRSQQPSGAAVLTNLEQAALSFSTVLTERLSGTVSAIYNRRRSALREIDVDLSRVRYARVEAGLSWQMSSRWQVGASVGDSLQRVGSIFSNDQTGRGYDARLSVSWNGKSYVH